MLGYLIIFYSTCTKLIYIIYKEIFKNGKLDMNSYCIQAFKRYMAFYFNMTVNPKNDTLLLYTTQNHTNYNYIMINVCHRQCLNCHFNTYKMWLVFSSNSEKSTPDKQHIPKKPRMEKKVVSASTNVILVVLIAVVHFHIKSWQFYKNDIMINCRIEMLRYLMIFYCIQTNL